jgi:NADH:ubiquinone oxidoreductase subunit 6 (subunit J)
MIFKLIAFIAAVVPLILFVRSMFFRRPRRVNERFEEFKKQANLAVTIFLVLIGCVVAWAAVKLIWTWM